MKPSGRPAREADLAAALAHANELGCGALVVGREHHPEGGHHDVEALVVKRQANAIKNHACVEGLVLANVTARVGSHDERISRRETRGGRTTASTEIEHRLERARGFPDDDFEGVWWRWVGIQRRPNPLT